MKDNLQHINEIEGINHILNIIDTLQKEPASEDLEEAADNYAQQHNELLGFDCDCEPIQTGPELKKAIIFGAEWQRKKDQEIDKLTESSDLDEASWKYSDRDGITYGQRYAMQIDFKAGAKWQKQQMKEALQTEYEKGRFDMQQEMMKDAISCNVDWYDGFRLDYTQEQQDDILLKLGADVGDKVKIIIIKEEQQ